MSVWTWEGVFLCVANQTSVFPLFHFRFCRRYPTAMRPVCTSWVGTNRASRPHRYKFSLSFPDLTLTFLYPFYAATKFFWVPSAPPILTRVGPPTSPLWAGRLLNLQHDLLRSYLPSPPPLEPNWFLGTGLTSFVSSFFALFQNNHVQQTKWHVCVPS